MPASKAASSHKAMRPWTPKTDMREQHADFAGGGGGGSGVGGGGGGGNSQPPALSLSPCLPPLSYYIIDRFYIALFSALQQTHRAQVACDSK